MSDVEGLYTIVGRKIRAAREHSTPRLSQDKLAKRLGMSRASIVNIEAGRQHAPLELLWKIAELLNVEATELMPHRSELLASEGGGQLNDEMRKQIEIQTNGNPALRDSVTAIVTHLVATLKSDQNRGRS